MAADISDASSATSLPPGFRSISLCDACPGPALEIHVVVREKADAVRGRFVVLRDTPDARVFLGCTADGAGCIRELLEIWVQDFAKLRDLSAAHQIGITNASVDERWVRQSATLRKTQPSSCISTMWESDPPPPLYFDSDLQRLAPLPSADGTVWQLCRDDALLAAAGLPSYSGSLHRYLVSRNSEGHPRFLSTAESAPTAKDCLRLDDFEAGLIPFNAAGGLMRFCTFGPIGFEEWIDLLSGEPWRGAEPAGGIFKPTGVYCTLQNAELIKDGGGHLFIGQRGNASRLLESFHLKATSLAQTIRTCADAVREGQQPLLNLGSDSFRVSLSATAGTLPYFYTARFHLAIPGDALEVPLGTPERRHFIPLSIGSSSIYRPERSVAVTMGRGTVRIRNVVPSTGGVIIEGTVTSQERLTASEDDFLRLDLAIAGERMQVVAAFENSNERLSAGEIRFRSWPQSVSSAVSVALQRAQGVPFADTQLEILPILSSGYDLYSLAVLAVRTMLVDDEQSLPVALDETLSLARKVAAEHQPGQSIEERISGLLAADSHWHEVFSPGRLRRGGTSEEEAWLVFPQSLWLTALGCVVRMFPALGPDSYCRSYGSVPDLALETVFQQPLIEMERISRISRNLIVNDPVANREIRSVIDSFLTNL